MKKLEQVKLSFSCPRAFNTLKPCAGGWYCNGCNKIVRDLRGMPEAAIQDILFKSEYKLCGLFEADRINIVKPVSRSRKWVAAAVLTLGFTSLHHIILAQQHPKQDTVKITEPTASEKGNSITVFGTVETAAQYPGGAEKFIKFIADQIKPDASCSPGAKAIATFVVEKDGQVSHVSILRSPFSKGVNAQIKKLIQQSPRWVPGTQLGKVVRQQYTVPVIPVAN